MKDSLIKLEELKEINLETILKASKTNFESHSNHSLDKPTWWACSIARTTVCKGRD